ncbi:PaaI family thioesterase [Aeromicrobium sp. UC242_57]|uniref:PaaI family thioesterase n=1 Tax=Aeromicrobium sp. UC242_57 TaxID=3374624 RepID=UPI0037BF72BA
MPFNAKCGFTVEAWAADAVTMRGPFLDENTNGAGTMHGGFISSLIDSVATAVVIAGAERGDRRNPVTTSLTVHYLGAASSAVLATATCSRRGKAMCFVDIAVTDETGRPIATAMVSTLLR